MIAYLNFERELPIQLNKKKRTPIIAFLSFDRDPAQQETDSYESVFELCTEASRPAKQETGSYFLLLLLVNGSSRPVQQEPSFCYLLRSI